MAPSSQPSSGPRGHFEVRHDAGQHWLRLVDDEGRALLTGGPHGTLTDVLGAIARLRDASAVWRARMTATGEYDFCVVDHEGDVLAQSPMYVAPSDRDDALADARSMVPDVALVVHGMGQRG